MMKSPKFRLISSHSADTILSHVACDVDYHVIDLPLLLTAISGSGLPLIVGLPTRSEPLDHLQYWGLGDQYCQHHVGLDERCEALEVRA